MATAASRCICYANDTLFARFAPDGVSQFTFETTKQDPPSNLRANIPTNTTMQASMPATRSGSPSTHGRHRDALSNPADETSSLTVEALAALSSISIPPHILAELRGILSKHDLKAQGVVKGRDISRLALKAKEAKMAELEARIASLEAEREVSRGVIRGLRWESEHGAHGAVGEE
jgi:hypothetical protein